MKPEYIEILTIESPQEEKPDLEEKAGKRLEEGVLPEHQTVIIGETSGKKKGRFGFQID